MGSGQPVSGDRPELGPERPVATPSEVTLPANHNDVGHAQLAAVELIRHSLWAALAFVVVVLIAVGLEWFSHALVKTQLIEKGQPLDRAIHIGAYSLLAIDVGALIAVVGKGARRLVGSL